MIPTVALVGRPNVGKSTIFNRLVGFKKSIVHDTPGATRDRIYSIVKYKDYTFNLIDTGGIDIDQNDFNKLIKGQALLAIDEADIIVFVTDGKEGINPNDNIIRDILLKSQKKVIVAINKADHNNFDNNVYEFYQLGFSDYVNISAEHNSGISNLLDLIIKDLPKKEEKNEDDAIKFSIIGRPNVGKSSLVNALLNEERVIVSDKSGTTTDAIDIKFKYNGNNFIVVDTAGVRKKGKIYSSNEKYSFLRTMKAIENSKVCILVLDSLEITAFDKHVVGYALDLGKALVIVVNKWDLVEDKDKKMKEYIEKIRKEFVFISYVPIIFLSALTKKRVHTLMPEIIKVNENAHKQIKTSLLNNVITDAYNLNLPPNYKGRRLKIYFLAQTNICPPTFTFDVNDKNLVHFSYKRYLENKIRENFDFEGTPIVLKFKNKKDR